MFGNKFPKMAALAKVAAASVTAELVEAVNAEIAEMEIEGVTMVLDSELESVNAQVTNLTNEATIKDNKIKDLETAASTHATAIENLNVEVAKWKGKPAADGNAPTSAGDIIPQGADSGDKVENYRTSVDVEYEGLYGKAE